MAVDRNAVIKEAQKLASKGQYDKALAEWRKLLKDFPSDSTIFNTIGDLSLKKGDAKGKIEAVEAYSRAGTILAAEGFSSKAIALYKKVLNIDPSRMEVHLALGDLNAEKGLTGPALESYKLVVDHFTKQKKIAEALGVYQKMADLNPSNVAFRVKLAGMYAKEGMKEKAVTAYLDAADAHMSKQAFQDARQMFEKVLELDPENKDVYYKAGIVYSKEGKFDEARKALKRAFDAAPDNEQLVTLYLEVLDKAGRGGDAEDVYRKLLAKDAARQDLREKLYNLLLAKKDFDRALPEAAALAGSKAETSDFAGAAELLRGFIADAPDPQAGAAALADLFSKNNRAKDGAKELLAAAEELIARGSSGEARKVLNRASALAPDLQEVKSKLAELEGGEAAPAPGPAAPQAGVIAPPPAPPAPEEAPPAEEEEPAVAGALAEVEVLVKYGLGSKAIDQLEGVLRGHLESIGLRAKLLDLYRKENKPDKAVIQALMLSELFEKKGKSEESLSVLREAHELAPGNPQIMAKLGISGVEAPEIPEVPEVPESIEEPEAFETLPDEAASAAPELEEAGGIEALELPEVPEEAEEPEEISIPEEDQFAKLPDDLEMEETPPPPEPKQRRAKPRPAPEETFERLEGREPLAEADLAELWAEAEFYYQQGLFDEAKRQYEEILEQNPGDSKAMERIVEITKEKEDVQEFSRLAEAVEGLESIVSSGGKTDQETATPADVDAVRSLMNELSGLRKQQAEEEQAQTAAEAGKPAESEGESLAGLMEELSAEPPASPPSRPAEKAPEPEGFEESFAGLMDEEPSPSRPARPAKTEAEESFADLMDEMSEAAAPAASGRPAAGTEESFAGLMDEESAAAPAAAPAAEDEGAGDFFDLAAELRDELGAMKTERPPAAGQEQSLDEIFEEFKAGVEAHEKKEDEDTHYNLGIAYREMGLLDDAISEFNMTTEGEPKFIQSRYLLGLCYLEKEDYETAITEMQKALGYSYSLGEASEERLGMHYDLGLAFLGMSNNTSALEEFQKVHTLDPSYREVSQKVKELQEGEFISLDSIKDDIEKEISFKFLEESDRIEREEKNKKSEKMK